MGEPHISVKLDLVETFLCCIHRGFHNCVNDDSVVNVIIQVQEIPRLIGKDSLL